MLFYPHKENNIFLSLPFLAAILSCSTWGFIGLLYSFLSELNPLYVLCQRIIWSTFFLVIICFFLKDRSSLFKFLKYKKEIFLLVLSGVFITINWFVFIFAIISEEALQASFGYYIFPMVAVLFGFIFKKERFSLLQILSIIMSLLAVVILGFALNKIPIISLILALSFGAYGLVKSSINTSSIISVMLETVLMLPLALIITFFLALQTGSNSFSFFKQYIHLFVLSGFLTATPLILFSFSTRKLNYSLIGFIQFINPTIQFLISIFIFREEFSYLHVFAMLVIWISVFLYCYNFRSFSLKPD